MAHWRIYPLAMSWIAPFFGLALIAGGVSYGIWHAWLLYQRGVTDRVWVFRETHTATQFLAAALLTHAAVRFFINGATRETAIWAIIVLVLLPTPYLFYAAGRLVGIWQRTRHGSLQEAGS